MNGKRLLKRWCTLALACVAATTAWAQPNPPGPTTQNPIADYYLNRGDGYPTWTNYLKWYNRIDMSTYTHGTNDFEKFEHARDSVFRMGGGVLYYPAGTYDFTNHPSGPNGRGLMLRRGVVILGEAPATDQEAIVDSANAGLTQLGTKFLFPFKTRTQGLVEGSGQYPDSWNVIGLMPEAGETVKDVTDVGIAWVNTVGAVVYMGPDMPWGPTWGTAGAWKSALAKNTGDNWAARVPDGTHYGDPFMGAAPDLDYNKSQGRRFVFGCRLDHAAATQDMISDAGGPASTNPDRPYDPDFLFNFRFAARLAVYGSNVFIGNNAIPKSDKTFKFTQMTGVREPLAARDILFNYSQQIGIESNKQLVSQRSNRCNLTNGPYYETNVVVRDNFVHNHGNKSYELSGKWLIIENNVAARDYLDQNATRAGLTGSYKLTLDGFQTANQIDDNMSRAMDLGGMNVWIHKNWYNNTGSDPGNDGEGILLQRHGAVEHFSWALTYNGQGPDGESGYIAPYDVHVLGLFHGWNRQRGSVGVIAVRSNMVQDAAIVGNINRQGNPVTATVTGVNVGDFQAGCMGGTAVPPVITSIDTLTNGEKGVRIEWADAAPNELAFRVDRRPVGATDWMTIAYRPRNETGSNWTYGGNDNGGPVSGCINQTADFNEQVWIDYLAPEDMALEYRVVAIVCDDDDAVNSGPSTPVTVTGNKNRSLGTAPARATLSLYPNPAKGLVNLSASNLQGAGNYAIYDAAGRIVASGKLADVAGASLPLGGLHSGLYRVVLNTATQTLSKSLVVE